MFKRGVIDDGDDTCSGCKSTSKMVENVDCVKELGHDSRRITTCANANMLRISLSQRRRRSIMWTCARTCKKGLKETWNSFHRQAQVMWLGLRGATHKSSKSHLCKTDNHLQGPRSKTSALKCEQHSHWFQKLHFAKCLEKWQDCYAQCIKSQGKYFDLVISAVVLEKQFKSRNYFNRLHFHLYLGPPRFLVTFSLQQSGQNVKLTTSNCARIGIHGATPPISHRSSWCDASLRILTSLPLHYPFTSRS